MRVLRHSDGTSDCIIVTNSELRAMQHWQMPKGLARYVLRLKPSACVCAVSEATWVATSRTFAVYLLIRWCFQICRGSFLATSRDSMRYTKLSDLREMMPCIRAYTHVMSRPLQ